MTNRQFIIWQRAMIIFGKLFRCHQLPDRSFHICNMQLPLCARCTGIFLGLVLVGPLCCAFLPISMYASMFLVFILFMDGYTQYTGTRKSNNILRLLTGIGYGYALVSFVFHVVLMIIKIVN